MTSAIKKDEQYEYADATATAAVTQNASHKAQPTAVDLASALSHSNLWEMMLLSNSSTNSSTTNIGANIDANRYQNIAKSSHMDQAAKRNGLVNQSGPAGTSASMPNPFTTQPNMSSTASHSNANAELMRLASAISATSKSSLALAHARSQLSQQQHKAASLVTTNHIQNHLKQSSPSMRRLLKRSKQNGKFLPDKSINHHHAATKQQLSASMPSPSLSPSAASSTSSPRTSTSPSSSSSSPPSSLVPPANYPFANQLMNWMQGSNNRLPQASMAFPNSQQHSMKETAVVHNHADIANLQQHRHIHANDMVNQPAFMQNAPADLSQLAAAPTVTAPGLGHTSEPENAPVRFRSYQAENWTAKYEELLEYRLKHNHCMVPNACQDNPSLAEWVKRQRYQKKLRMLGKHSTMSDDRIHALEMLGFVWNSHDAVWEERLKELKEYKSVHGSCNVPSKYPQNPQLAIWIKRQRRQYKFFHSNQPSTMTTYRIDRLNELGFAWNGRLKASAKK